MSRRPAKTYEQLRTEWYDKLKKEGFKDIETTDGSLISDDTHNVRYPSSGPEYSESKAQYYRAAGHFLYDHKFDSNLEKDIWELHCEGLSALKVTKVLKDRGRKIYRRIVEEAVLKLKKVMLNRG